MAAALRYWGLIRRHSNGNLTNLVGIQLQSSALPANMTVQEAMLFFCAYHQTAPRYDLIERLQLGAKEERTIWQPIDWTAAPVSPGPGSRPPASACFPG